MVGLGMYLYKGSMVMYMVTWSLVRGPEGLVTGQAGRSGAVAPMTGGLVVAMVAEAASRSAQLVQGTWSARQLGRVTAAVGCRLLVRPRSGNGAGEWG